MNNESVFLTFFHEIENHLDTISQSTDIIGRSCPNSGKIDKQSLICHSSIIQENVELMKLHVSLVNIETNPSFFEIQKEKPIDLYSAFKRITYIFKQRAKKNNIKFEIEADKIPVVEIRPIINLAPFIIFDNCMKYSPSGCTIYLSFEKIKDALEVKIESMGPKVDKDEIDKILDKGFRGRNAIELTEKGNGIGLYYLKKICDLCNIKLDITSDTNSYFLNNIEYSNFRIKISIDKTNV